ncbi:MAG: hypothetical protein P4L99_16815 [Chthoniobacter sp.]|nr:hypothetical protein [Chthoniobacter sp.]
MARKRRHDLAVRQADVAEIIGCNTMTVVNWEKSHTAFPQINYMAGLVFALLGRSSAGDEDTVEAPSRREFRV